MKGMSVFAFLYWPIKTFLITHLLVICDSVLLDFNLLENPIFHSEKFHSENIWFLLVEWTVIVNRTSNSSRILAGNVNSIAIPKFVIPITVMPQKSVLGNSISSQCLHFQSQYHSILALILSNFQLLWTNLWHL